MGEIYSWMMRNSVLPIYDLAKGTSRFKFGRILEKTQWLSRPEIERLQSRNLRVLLKHAYETVPYYKRVFDARGLSPSDIKSVNDLVKLPILTKEDIQRNIADLISRDFPRNRLIPYKTGGSADQINFYLTKEKLSWEVAAEYRAYRWAGYRLGDPCFMFWGSHMDLSGHKSMARRIIESFERISIADTYVMSDEVLGRCAYSLEKFKPEIVRGYTTSVYMMAKYLLEKGVRTVRPRAVITSAEALLDLRRKTIEEAFGCPVFDLYGAREIGAIAAECEEHSGYHISAENVISEFVMDNEHVPTGERGLILLTSLRNFGMPLIRYKIGDVGRPSDEVCNCGRGLPLMSSIEGRMSDFMAVYDRRLRRIVPMGPIYPVIILALMQVPLKSCRAIQVSLDKIVVKAVKDHGYSSSHTDFLINYLHKFLGDNVMIEIEFVDFLPPLPSGKRSVFISQLNPFQTAVI